MFHRYSSLDFLLTSILRFYMVTQNQPTLAMNLKITNVVILALVNRVPGPIRNMQILNLYNQ